MSRHERDVQELNTSKFSCSLLHEKKIIFFSTLSHLKTMHWIKDIFIIWIMTLKFPNWILDMWLWVNKCKCRKTSHHFEKLLINVICRECLWFWMQPKWIRCSNFKFHELGGAIKMYVLWINQKLSSIQVVELSND